MNLDKPTVIKLHELDTALFSDLKDLCIEHDMLKTESSFAPFVRCMLRPVYALLRFLSRSIGAGLADATSMHKHYNDRCFVQLSTEVQKAAEKEVHCELSLVTAMTHKAKTGEFSRWHNGYYSPYIYDDNADVLSVWIPLQTVSPNTGSGFRFWYGESITNKCRLLCSKRWDKLDAKPRATHLDIVRPGKALKKLYRLAGDSDGETAKNRCTCYARLGEAILFNEYWPHKTTKWLGEGTRLSIVLRFVKKGTRLNRLRLKKRQQALDLDDAEWAQYCTYISRIEGRN